MKDCNQNELKKMLNMIITTNGLLNNKNSTNNCYNNTNNDKLTVVPLKVTTPTVSSPNKPSSMSNKPSSSPNESSAPLLTTNSSLITFNNKRKRKAIPGALKMCNPMKKRKVSHHTQCLKPRSFTNPLKTKKPSNVPPPQPTTIHIDLTSSDDDENTDTDDNCSVSYMEETKTNNLDKQNVKKNTQRN